MKISEIFHQERVSLSFEVFPPKSGGDLASVLASVDALAAGRPDFISVTYGAGGGTGAHTVGIASHIEQQGVTALAHLTCVSSTYDQVETLIANIRAAGIENILALRGDIPADAAFPLPNHYQYAEQLITQIHQAGDFCIGAACYPEGHVECTHQADDIAYLKRKVDAGVDFLTTQMFFDNNILYNFLYKIRERGITVPIIAGVMPVTNGRQISRICQLSGTHLPSRFKTIVDKFGDTPAAMQQAGVAYATEQIIDLVANGVKAIHIYSMNKPEVALGIKRNLSHIIGSEQ